MDKHRRLQLPNMVTGDLCLETGLDVGDGTRTMYRPGQRHSSYVYSVAQRFPDEWFGTIFVISPLIDSLYGVKPKIRKSSARRNGICLYLNSRAIVLFKHKSLGLPVGQCSRIASIPRLVRNAGEVGLQRFIEGFQYADGSFVGGTSPCIRLTTSSVKLREDLARMAERLSVRHSVSKDHPDVGFSLRISRDESMRRWMDHIPLLNPVQIAKFLTWQKYSECPAGLFLSQYLELAFGDISLRKFSMNSQRKLDRVPLFQESVDLVTRFALSEGPVSMVDLARRTVARTIYDAKKSVDRLNHLGFVKLSILNGRCIVSLPPAGLESVDAFQEAWGVLRRINPRIFPLKSYEDRIIAETECRGKPRLVNKTLTLASSA